MQQSNNIFGDQDPQMQDYYEHYWGKPVYDENRLFEFLTLEIFQAGLSWKTVWLKHEAFERDFAGFEIEKVAAFGADDLLRLASDPGIIRNRQKIQASIDNARILQDWHAKGQSLSNFCWSLVDHMPQVIEYPTGGPLPVTNPISDRLGQELKKAGFKYCGAKVMFSFMCAVGMFKLQTK